MTQFNLMESWKIVSKHTMSKEKGYRHQSHSFSAVSLYFVILIRYPWPRTVSMM